MQLRRLLLRSLLGARLPKTEGTLHVPGLQGAITIRRDRHGIAYVDAEHEHDAWFGLGFCQAQDRAFQLELRLRTARGTLSALAGPQTLAIDRLSRRIGFHEASLRQLDVLDADVRAQIEAFVRGVNAGLAAGARRVAPEFAILRARPTEWQPADVLGVGKLVAFLLIGNWDVELARLKILAEDGPRALRDLDPVYPDDQPVVMPPEGLAGAARDRLGDDLAAFVSFAGRSGGSNAWAIAGSRTASGRPILANDPHLEASLPPHWYLAHLRAPGWAVAGASLAGTPAIVCGHDGFAAWGVTAGLVDVVDLFIEEPAPEGASVRREVIEVRGRPPVVEEVVVTPRGPVIGPALEGEVGAVSLRAVWLDARPARGFLRAGLARSFDGFRAEFAAWPFSQNVVYADETGRIAWQLAGEAPRRRKGWGTLPQPASDAQDGWFEEGVPFEEMPFTVDPPAGFLASANNKPQADAEGPFLGVDWLDGYRAGRIVEALGARSDWDLASTQRLQLDETTLAWRQVRDAVLGAPPSSPEARLALDLLRDWDGVLAAGSNAATVFQLFVAEVWRRVARARAPRSAEWALGRGFTPLLPLTTFAAGRASRVLGRIVEQPAGWFERPWPEELADALATAVRDLKARFGPSPSAWAWGRVRPLTLEHPLGRLKLLAPVFNRGPFAWGGNGDTISAAATTPLRPLGNPTVIASLRFAVEAGDWDGARFVLPGGQSGNPFSPHYDDLLPFWRRGEGVPIAWSEQAVAEAAMSTLRLEPL